MLVKVTVFILLRIRYYTTLSQDLPVDWEEEHRSHGGM